MGYQISRDEFDILEALAEEGQPLSQEQLSQRTGHPLDSINGIVEALDDSGLIQDGAITQEGLAALEPYRVKRAIFVAAGFGSRLLPITLNTPKPLVRVHGTRIIDTLLDAVLAAGIEEIYIVRGYLAEEFEVLKFKYPMIQFLENPLYNEANNISSALVARTLFSNAYVFEADLLLSNPALITKYRYESEFLGIPVDQTDDWCCDFENGAIKNQRKGGSDCYQMIGISHWSEADGIRLMDDIPEAFALPEGKDMFWEMVPLRVFADKYKVGISECTFDDIVEIDSFEELKAIDSAYDV